GMEAGAFTLVARDTPEPSPLSHEVLNAKPYAFLDDAPLEERRTQAVITRRGLDVKTADELGKLDQAAIDRVKDEAWPDVSSADELHDALLVTGALPSAECGVRNPEWQGYFGQLVQAGRAGVLQVGPGLWLAAERLPMLAAVFPGARCEPALTPPERERARTWMREDALRELVRGRLEVVGPTAAAAVAGGRVRVGDGRAAGAVAGVRSPVARRTLPVGGDRLGEARRSGAAHCPERWGGSQGWARPLDARRAFSTGARRRVAVARGEPRVR